VAALSAELAHLRAQSRDPCSCTRNRRSGSRPPSRDDAKSTLCWYHRHYRAQAQKCTQPCSFRHQEKQNSGRQQQHMSALQPQTVSSSRTSLVSANSCSIRVQTSPYTPAGSFRDAKYATTTTSAWLTALPSPPI
jgi:hypothetical protein